MNVLESQLRSKAGKCLDHCEDAFVATRDFVGVVDGATSVTGRRWTADQLTGGQWAARILCEAIQENLTHDMSPSEIVETLTLSLFQAYKQERGALKVLQKQPEQRASASLVLYSRHLRQVIQVGDCQAAFVDHTGTIVKRLENSKYIDRVTAEARAMFWQAEKLMFSNGLQSYNRDPGRDLIQPLLVRQYQFQNNKHAPQPYRYWVLDGFPIEPEGIMVHNVPSSVKHVILASDGYPTLFSTLQETEQHLSNFLKEDPMMVGRYKATKGLVDGAESFDDRSFVRIQIECQDIS